MRDPKSGNFFFMAKSGNFGKNVEKVVAQCSLKYYAEEAISVIMKHILNCTIIRECNNHFIEHIWQKFGNRKNNP